MKGLFYLIAVLLAIGWVLGTFYWNASGMIHLLLLLAVIALLFGIIQKA